MICTTFGCSKDNKKVTTNVTFSFIDKRSSTSNFLATLSTFSDFNCYAVMATYPELPAINFCSDTAGTDFLRPDNVVGMESFPLGQAQMNVLVGTNREFNVIGWNWSRTDPCPAISSNFDSYGTDLSEAYVLGKVVDIPIEPTTDKVSITIKDEGAISNYKKVENCRGPLFDWGSESGSGTYYDYARLLSGVVAYWSFDETTNPNANNAIGNGNDGTVTGSPLRGVTGASSAVDPYPIDGSAIRFNASGQYVSTPTTSKNDFSFISYNSSFTISFWVKFGDISSDQYLIGNVDKTSCGTQSGFYMTYAPSALGNIEFTYCPTPNTQVYTPTTTAIAVGIWYHVLVRGTKITNTTTAITITVDGDDAGTNTITNGASGSVSSEIFMGQNTLPNAGYELDGYLDEVVILNRVTTDPESYTLGRGIFDGNLTMTCADCGSVSGTTAVKVKSSWQINTSSAPTLSTTCASVTALTITSYDDDQDVMTVQPTGTWDTSCTLTISGSLTNGDTFTKTLSIN